jgi:ATP-dependent HslUV protease subunit HslV
MSDPTRRLRATTILGVRRGDTIALAGDGQVTYGDVVLKHGARKIRTLYDGQILAGFAGAVADALTLFTKFEAQLKSWDGNLRRASVELAKEWRTDRYLRRLEAQLIVGDPESLLLLSGDGDVIEPDDGIAAIGSGAAYATAAAKALLAFSELDARAIVEASMTITAEMCIFTNDRFTIETVTFEEAEDDEESSEDEESAQDKDLPIDGPVPAPSAKSDDDDDEDDEDDDDANNDEADASIDDDDDPRTMLSRRRR